jgi:hypothetical protein
MRCFLMIGTVLLGSLSLGVLAGCGDDDSDFATPPMRSVIVFNGEANRLNAYDPADGFRKQTVVPSNADAPGGVGRDLNGQICFRRDGGAVHFIGGEDTNQGQGHATAGWGYFTLTGTRVGDLGYEEIGKLIPTYQQTPDAAENYGCGFLADGRLVTTDVGDQASGPPNGQLIMWFPPFDTGTEYTATGVVPVHPAHYCKLDIAIGTAGGILVDSSDRIYVASARVDPGIYRYTGPFPTSDTAAGGCGQVDSTGAPVATQINKELFIAPDNSVTTISGIARSPKGTLYVSSVLNGVIAEYDANGVFIRRVLSRAAGDNTLPFQTGTPFGLGVDSDGSLYYADIGLVASGINIGPGSRAGTVRRIRFLNDEPQPPETMDTGLNFPDGIGVLEP